MKFKLILSSIALLCIGLAQFSIARAAPERKTLEIGAAAPEFKLPGVDDKTYSLADFAKARVLVIVFTCNHCPTAQAYDDRLIQLDKDFRANGVTLVAISPNDPESVRLDEMGYTDLGDSLAEMKQRAKDKSFAFPYLYDGETQSTATAYGVIATPHVFIFDENRKLRYQGGIDNSDIGKVTQQGARDAIEALLAGKPVPAETTRVFGCSTKWAEKKQTGETYLKRWDAEPVALETIDLAGVEQLAKNDTDKLRLVNLWATWCGPCVQELPELVTMNRMYRKRPFEMITLSLDDADAKAQALQTLTEKHVAAKNYLVDSTDRDKLAAALDAKWPGPVPYTLLIAPGGKIIYRHDGPIEPLELKRAIVDYLGRTYAGKK